MITKEQLSNPILQTHHVGELELAMRDVFGQLVEQTLLQNVRQNVDYGTPFLGGIHATQQFIKLYGIGMVGQDGAVQLLQIILREYLSLATKRGLAFLTFLLDMLYPNKYQLIRLYHGKSKAHLYPKNLFEQDGNDRFLTSRIRIKMNDEVDLKQLSNIVPAIKRLSPAHIVPSVSVSMALEPKTMGVAVVLNGAYYFNARLPNQIIRHDRTINHDGTHVFTTNVATKVTTN